MNTISVTLGTLIDRTIMHLEGATDRPLTRTLASALTASATDVTFTLDDADGISVSDVVEVGSELLLVTAKNSDPVPVITVSRGYYFTTVAAHAIGDVVAVNPRHPRRRIAEAIRRVTDSTAHQFTAIFNGVSSFLYLDGTAILSNVNPSTPGWSSKAIPIGARDPAASAGWPGEMTVGEGDPCTSGASGTVGWVTVDGVARPVGVLAVFSVDPEVTSLPVGQFVCGFAL